MDPQLQVERRRNQHKPLRESLLELLLFSLVQKPATVALPKEELEHWIWYYWNLGFPDTKIADHVLDHFDRDKFGLR
jgi:hypothetical protein